MINRISKTDCMKRIVLALYLILAVSSTALCDDRYVYIDMEVSTGNKWYLDTQSISRNYLTGTLSYRIEMVLSDQYKNYLISQSLQHSYDEQYVAERTAYIMLYQTVNVHRNEFTNTRVTMHDEYGKLLKSSELNDSWYKITPVNMTGEVVSWINTNRPSAIQSEYSTVFIVIFFLVGGAVISLLIGGLIEFMSYIMTEPDAPLSTEEVMHEAEVIDTEFTDAPESDDYDYPYEDISQVLRGRQ